MRVRHVHLDLEVRFDARVMAGSVTLHLERVDPVARTLVVDTRDLVIHGVELESADGVSPAAHTQGERDPILGMPLVVSLRPDTQRVRVSYETGVRATALQWMTPEQTAGGRHPFLFTQSQAIHARSWIPLQDTPGVRVTFDARVRTPRGLRAVMSAAAVPDASRAGEYVFEMRQPVPSYLIALAVGDLAFERMGPRTGVFAEPSVVKGAAREFEDTEAMIDTAERLYGPYRWERYDLLVLPPSFPFGGMENPRLTFATPTVLAGDKSLVSLVAHELAHSWSGNLVTNATWCDFWLNEGFTTYIERRIVEEVFGRERYEMESVLGHRVLLAELDRLAERDGRLHLDLAGRDPDEGLTQVAYEKGALFLRRLESAFGRPRFDEFVRGYFDTFAFRSITTGDFVEYLNDRFEDGEALRAARVDLEAWIEGGGLPPDAPRPESRVLSRVEDQMREWVAGRLLAADLAAETWTTHEWLHFLSSLPEDLPSPRLAQLDEAFGLTAVRNAEIAHAWLRLTVEHDYSPADRRLEEYLLEVGRRKLIQPLYEALAATPRGLRRARSIYQRARPGYHPISVETIDALLGNPGSGPDI